MIAILGAITFGVAMVMYILLVLGLPLGEFALGGKYKVLPLKYRIVCAVSVFVQLFAILIILQTGGVLPLLFSRNITKGICFFFAVYLSLNVMMNFLSKSKREKWIVGPVSLITAVCLWLTAFIA
jgi:hypothetical protein